MGRGVRLLMKVPAVRRVMLRLLNVEEAIAKQQAALNALEHHRGQLSAEHAQIESVIQTEHEKIDELIAQQAQSATRDATQSMQAKIDALIAQVNRLIADSERYRAGLAEVSQHLPPAHRMNHRRFFLGALAVCLAATACGQQALTPMEIARDE